MLTKAELAEIKARADAATDGPWDWERDGPTEDGEGPLFGFFNPTRDGKDRVVSDWKDGWLIIRDADADFIAHSRSDIPALLAHIEELRAALEEAAELAYMEIVGTSIGWHPNNLIDGAKVPHLAAYLKSRHSREDQDGACLASQSKTNKKAPPALRPGNYLDFPESSD